MSRWAGDPERAADDLIARCLDAIAPAGRCLLAYQDGGLPALVARRGLELQVWNRRAGGDGIAHPWPEGGNFATAFLRLPRARAEQEMATHACLGALSPGGRLIVYGGNDEGIRSFAGIGERLCGGVETLATRGHGRVLAMRRPVGLPGLRGELSAWRAVQRLSIGEGLRDWVSYPGVFAADGVDEGTKLLVAALPSLQQGQRVLDFGCGSGVIGASLQAQVPSLALDLLDHDSVALEAARENVPGARTILGRNLNDTGAARYDAIVSNPPLHRGIAEDHALLEQLIADAPGRLVSGGLLQIVVQRRIPLERLLAKDFSAVTVVAETSRYRVWAART